MDCATTDPSLLDALKDTANEAAWERFHQLYRPRILHHCRSVGLSEDQCDDVVQECFLKCFRYLPQWDYKPAVGRFRGWLNLQVNQQIAEHFRRIRRHERGVKTYSQLLRWVSSAEPNTELPSEEFDQRMLDMALQKTRLTVKPHHWQYFEAYVIGDLPSGLVARQFGATPVAVRVASLRVRLALKRHWKELCDGPF